MNNWGDRDTIHKKTREKEKTNVPLTGFDDE